MQLKANPSFPSTPSQADYAVMVQQRRRELVALANKLGAESLTPGAWADLFNAVLQKGHGKAWFLGRVLAGDLRPFGDTDVLKGIAKADEDADYLRGFLDDLLARDPRYWDEDGVRLRQVLNRMNLYIGKMRGTANEALVESSPKNIEWYWRLGAAEEHCQDCPQLAALSPYSRDANLGYPGSGDTECLGNCTCYIELSNGLRGFDPA